MSVDLWQQGAMLIREATAADWVPISETIMPVFREGTTYKIDRHIAEHDALNYWLGADRTTFVAEVGGTVVGTYYLRRNQAGGGAHVSNCGYITARAATGMGVGQGMWEHSIAAARRAGLRAMQFNFVISSNERAIRLWERLGYDTVGRLSAAFHHPTLGYVDALVMYRKI